MTLGGRFLLSAAIALGGVAAVTPAQADTGTASVTVIVTDSLAQPLPGACLIAQPSTDSQHSGDSGDPNATAGPDGAATIFLQPGSWVLHAEPCGTGAGRGLAERYVGGDDRISSAQVVTVGGSGNQDLGSVSLPQQGSISGTVTDDSGQPVGNACVQLVDVLGGDGQFYQEASAAQTDAEGHYTYSGIYPRNQIVGFAPCGMAAPQSYWYHATSATQATPVAVQPGQTTIDIDGVLSAGATVSGTIADNTGAAVTSSDVCVRVYDTSDYTRSAGVAQVNPDGTFTATGVPAGTMEFDASVCGTEAPLPDLLPAKPADVTVAKDASITGLALTMRIGAHVTGTVRDKDGNPMSGMCVSPGNNDPITSASDGSYDLYPFDTGDVTVEVTDCGTSQYAASWWPHALWQSDASKIPVTAGTTTSGIDLTLDTPGASISGHASDTSGTKLFDVCVSLSHADKDFFPCAYTGGSDLAYTIPDLPAASDLEVYATDSLAGNNYLPDRVDGISTTAGQATALELTLPSAGSITGTVVDQRGLPILGVGAFAYCPGQSGNNYTTGGSYVTDSQGRYTITGIDPGTCTVSFDDADRQLPFSGYYGYPLMAKDVTVTSGQTTTLPTQLVITVQPPTAPTAVSVVTGDGSAVLSWLPPLSDGYAPITGYTVTNAAGAVVGATGGSLHALALSHLTDGQTYTVAVVAANRKGVSPASSTLSFTPRKGLPVAVLAHPAKPVLKLTVKRKHGRYATLGLSDTGAATSRKLVLQALRGKTWVTLRTLVEDRSGRWSATVGQLIPKPATQVRLAVLVGKRTPTYTRGVRAV